MYRANDENAVNMCGTVIEAPQYDHSLYEESFYSLKLAVPRLSGTEDVLPVTISQRQTDAVASAGECLCVSGQLRSYNKHVDGVNRLIITVFAREVNPVSVPDAYNDVHLTGYLCKPVVFRTTPFYREISDMLIAVNRSFGKSDYLPCIAWGKNARFVRDIPIGSRLDITGRLQSRQYSKTLEDGTLTERIAYEVSCSTIELI